jgi:hypothetical protein
VFLYIHPHRLQYLPQFEIKSNPLDVIGFIVTFAFLIALIVFMNVSKRIRNSAAFKGEGIEIKIGSGLKVDGNFYNKVKRFGLSRKEAAVLEEILKSDTGDPYEILLDHAKLDENFELAYKRILRENSAEEAQTDLLELFTIRNAVELFLAAEKSIPAKNALRNFRRKSTNINCEIYLVITEGANSKSRKKLVLQPDTMHAGIIQNISQGGCSIMTTDVLKISSLIKINFKIGSQVSAALGQVVRINKEAREYIYHIKFLKLSKQTIIDLNAFIFEY